MIALPLFDKNSQSSLTTEGKYRLVFGKGASSVLSIPYAQRKTLSIPLLAGFTIWTEDAKEDLYLFLSFEEKDAKEPISKSESKIPLPVVYGVLGIAGLALGSLFLKRVEKVIDNPVIELALILGIVVGGTYAFKALRSLITKK